MKYYGDDIVLNGQGDGGLVFDFTCPKCKSRMHVTEHPWEETVCQCGIKWELLLEIEGQKIEMEEDTCGSGELNGEPKKQITK
jgi:hypothetical protein